MPKFISVEGFYPDSAPPRRFLINLETVDLIEEDSSKPSPRCVFWFLGGGKLTVAGDYSVFAKLPTKKNKKKHPKQTPPKDPEERFRREYTKPRG